MCKQLLVVPYNRKQLIKIDVTTSCMVSVIPGVKLEQDV